ncbi:lysine--tRNA ligase [Frankia sp. CNm7]|uniref:Lysine--tRNA ligase n=1 Tax=Frankia nepalensis TaxID=1836974 RepID=A0A937UPW8_9ACTN|nr:lysine--tRNA ligase [Frankia nepalensis]MBL7495066.1 lysine--tRNA ligase [Frankia nepalensis]MBL7513166.1 lysine--tRNA ligase [Frankia nepalensis]MBL7522263.1 lysine--tRNA ligase [Frankia nepalensis]MBL7629503.1 lysine--tRNA ligase [Frankia nepalensis]
MTGTSEDESTPRMPRSGYQTDTVAAAVQTTPDGTPARIAGRLVLWRRMGGLVFGHIQDRSGRVQISLARNDLGEETFKAWHSSARVGDFVGVTGTVYTTRKGERTVAASDFTVLNRAVRALPDKWHGVADVETRYRRRYLDLLANPESRERFQIRSRVISRIRRFLDEADFLEVETPILTDAASGAAARPFITRHNALGEDFYLRISPETYLKRVVAGSFDRVYEIGRNFRNEGIDPSHLQEFTMLEWYAAYWDYRDNMNVVRELIRAVLDDVVGSRAVTYEGVKLDFGADWPVLDYREEVQRRTGVDLRVVRDFETLKEKCAAFGLDVTKAVSYAGLVDLLYKKTVRPELVQPCFLVGHPVELVPLARRNDEDPTRLDMFQVVVNGWEIVKAYSELVDPVDQRARLEEQAELRAAGDDETMMLEEDFIEAMEYGMPPMSGLGLGIDRFVALLTDAPTLRDVVLFPSMRGAKGGEGAPAGEDPAERAPAENAPAVAPGPKPTGAPGS